MTITWKKTGPNKYEVTGDDADDNFLLISNNAVLDADNLIHAGGGKDFVYGGGGNDEIYGDAGEDFIDGGWGNDYLNGGAGQDHLVGGVGHDVLDGGSSYGGWDHEADILDGGAGNDTYVIRDNLDIIVNEELYQSNDTVDLRTSSIDLTTSASLRSIENVLINTYRNAMVTGNDLNNVIDGSKNYGAVTVHGGLGNDTITGSKFADTLYGDEGNDTLFGLDGNDTLIGGAGNDTLHGGKGDDYYQLSHGDKIVEIANEGYDKADVYFSSYTMDANLEEATLKVSSATLFGNDQANVMRGSDGNDTLIGRGGDDKIIGGAGDDFLSGGSGNNILDGGIGNDVYFVESTTDTVIESIFSNGIDEIHTTLTSYTISDTVMVENLEYIGLGNFTGKGNSLDNEISGATGNDWLYGNAGNDTLIGGGGKDHLYGGSGSDNFVFSNDRSNTGSIVHDFELGKDKLVLEGDGLWGWTKYDADTVLLKSFSGGGVITIEGTDHLNFQTDVIWV